MRNVMAFILCITVGFLGAPAIGQPETKEGITAITIPSADITLSFLQAGRIDNIKVKEGDKVSATSLLIEQYMAAELASLSQKKVDLKRLESAKKRGAATNLEVEHAQLELNIAQIRVDNMKLLSPIDGFVEKVHVEVGESAQGLSDVIRVVRIDPLWIDVHVPQARASEVKVGGNAVVQFPGTGKETTTGKIIFVSRAADAASSTLRTRIEVTNKSNRPAGESIKVIFPESDMIAKSD